MERHEHRYFNGPVENYKGESSEDIRKYVRQDYERMESLNAGNWYYIGIRAEASVIFGTSKPGDIAPRNLPNFCFIPQTITSGGLWGIESGSGRHLPEVEEDELSELRNELKALGFSTRAISQAFKSVERKDS